MKKCGGNSKLANKYYLQGLEQIGVDNKRALELTKKAIELNPNHHKAHNTLGIIYAKNKNYSMAYKCFITALNISPNFDSLTNLGIISKRTGHLNEAIKFYKMSLELNPGDDNTLFSVGNLYYAVKQYNDAVEYFKKAMRQNKNNSMALASLLFLKNRVSDWSSNYLYNHLDKLNKIDIEKGVKTGESPYMNLIRVENPKINQEISELWSDDIWRNRINFNFKTSKKTKQKKNKLRLGFVSDGFGDHPTGQNIVQVLELLNKERYKIYLYSLLHRDENNTYQRLKVAAHKYCDASQMNYANIAKVIYEDKIDILIDLKGYAPNNRFDIFALRPAPIQITWLGFPGTTGADFIDYAIVDKVVVPDNHKKYWSEKLLYMPQIYRPMDNTLKLKKNLKKSDYGLPEDKFIFASFNNPQKIQPKLFNIWCEILHAAPNSILWIFRIDKESKVNLLSEFKKNNIESDRIVFAEALPRDKHISRIALADLALDTHPTNGHVTSVDILFAGIPLITITGKHFSSRVSTSVLAAIGLDELCVKSYEDYKKIAVRLANKPKELNRIKKKLAQNSKTHYLFNTEKFTKDFESLLEKVWGEYNRS